MCFAQYDPASSREARLATRREIREKWRRILATKNMSNVTFDVEEVDSLPLDRVTGKFRKVVKSPQDAARSRREDWVLSAPATG